MKNKVYIFDRTLEWIKNNTINNSGITVTTKRRYIYPEVTGYYIPTLLLWGEKELALSYAKYLCSIQREDGSWYDSMGEAAYIFDSAQILKGLISIRNYFPEVDPYIIRGCNWIVGCMTNEGRLITPNTDAWGNDGSFCSELVHTYCLSPLVDASKLFDNIKYWDAAIKIKKYYIKNYYDKILNFSLLSHFYAYVMEGLLDMGEEALVRKAMNNIERYQYRNGGIKALNNVNWLCSTGMFQLALVWYKLGELEKGNIIFNCACSLQNKSGGWYGGYSYPVITNLIPHKKFRPFYFADEEISWANKYFLDSLSLKLKLEFERYAPIFCEDIDRQDGRYQLVRKYASKKGVYKICDAGCGKGRYIKNLLHDFPNKEYYCIDVSEKVMKNICDIKEKKVASLTNIPYKDDMFDLVYVCEALEHVVAFENALKELFRIVKAGGTLIIIDKPIEKQGILKTLEWEKWIDSEKVKNFIQSENADVEIISSVAYENKNDGLFNAWIINKH